MLAAGALNLGSLWGNARLISDHDNVIWVSGIGAQAALSTFCTSGHWLGLAVCFVASCGPDRVSLPSGAATGDRPCGAHLSLLHVLFCFLHAGG